MVTKIESPIQGSPVLAPRMSGLLDHAEIHEGIAWVQPEGLGLSFNCLSTDSTTGYCGPSADPKDFSTPSVTEGAALAVYGGIACKPFGFSESTGASEVVRVFGLNESKGVERGFMTTLAVAESPRWGAATDITPVGGPVGPRRAVAIMEGYAASVYAGQPTIHLPYTLGAYLAGRRVIADEGGLMFTRLGAKAAVGAGYEYPNAGPDGQAPAAGELWAYVSGQVVVGRSEIAASVQLDRDTNDIYALAERQYIVAADCFIAAIRVNMEEANG